MEKKILDLLVNTKVKYSFVQKDVTMYFDRYQQNLMIWTRNFLPNTDIETHKLVIPE